MRRATYYIVQELMYIIQSVFVTCSTEARCSSVHVHKKYSLKALVLYLRSNSNQSMNVTEKATVKEI